jgi:hypothetical protein
MRPKFSNKHGHQAVNAPLVRAAVGVAHILGSSRL